MARQVGATNQPDAILIISHDVVGSRMAGPGIRYWELSRVVAQHFRVILAVPGHCDLDTDDIDLWSYDSTDWKSLAPAVKQARVVLSCGDVLVRFPALGEGGIPLVVDGYDPHTLETLALVSGSLGQESLHQKRERILQLQCRLGDFFICASERQRDWWLGLLEATGRINVHTYGGDPSLRRLIDVVPFGLRSSPIRHTRQVLKGIWPGIGPGDKVVLWGGGLWQWLDPITAIRALARIQQQRTDVKMVFPGTRHPNRAAVPEMPILQDAVDLAETLGLLNQAVFFGDWVPYEEWPNYLVESDVALSLHLNTVEARLAFRSRVLDYVWAGLPMVVTAGDATSDLVSRYGLGETVGYGDVKMVSQALLKLLDLPRTVFASAFHNARASLTWERAADPLIAFCRNPYRAADKAAGYRPLWDAVKLEKLCADQHRELERLRSLVRGYESGRFIRFTKWVRNLRLRR
jgi:glycosyltransferase involved in cell wall biosynthesis